MRCNRYGLPPSFWFACDPFPAMNVVPKSKLQMSPFSPKFPVQALSIFTSGSVTDSDNSWNMMLTVPSPPTSLFGLVLSPKTAILPSQADGQRPELPTNEYLIVSPV